MDASNCDKRHDFKKQNKNTTKENISTFIRHAYVLLTSEKSSGTDNLVHVGVLKACRIYIMETGD